jgi:hypothetical protein
MADETSPPSAIEPSPNLPAELAPVLALLDRGDHRGAAALLARVLAEKPAPEVEQAARALEARLAPDRAALAVGLGTVALLLVITLHYIF